MVEHIIKLSEEDWKTVLAILDVKTKSSDKEEALEINGIYWRIKQQVLEQM